MSEQPEFFTYTRDEFLDEFVHPDDRAAVEDARQRRTLQVRAEYLTEMRKKAGLTQAEVAEAMGVSQQRVSAIESGGVAELATLADYIRALGGELGVRHGQRLVQGRGGLADVVGVDQQRVVAEGRGGARLAGQHQRAAALR